jgi:phage-related protein
VSKGVSSVVKFITGLKDKVVSAMKTAGTWLLKVGENIMNGLVKGIANGFSWVKAKITELGSNIVSWAKSILHINSPSKVMRDQVGRAIPEGIALGITKNSHLVKNASDKLNSMFTSGNQGVSIRAAMAGSSSSAAGAAAGAAGSTNNSQQNNLTQNFNYFGVQTGSDRRQQSEWYHRYAAQFGSPTMAQGGN